MVRWVCITHAARAPTTLHGAAGRILLITVPLGAMTLVQQLVLHILRAPSATARDDRSWVHDAPCRAAAPPVHSERSTDVRRATVWSMWTCRLHVVRVSAGGVQLAGVKRGRQDADAAALRRATHSTFISSRARASSCRKYQDACLLRRAPSAGPSVACLATEVVTGDQVEHDDAGEVGGRERVPFSE